ncbi:hypothetical protein AZA_19543 [Nitrospirillum viridazoti Y2]|nr:hypothetical protein AZA_19543 [Nitrospirillum amazonense Y2]
MSLDDVPASSVIWADKLLADWYYAPRREAFRIIEGSRQPTGNTTAFPPSPGSRRPAPAGGGAVVELFQPNPTNVGSDGADQGDLVARGYPNSMCRGRVQGAVLSVTTAAARNSHAKACISCAHRRISLVYVPRNPASSRVIPAIIPLPRVSDGSQQACLWWAFPFNDLISLVFSEERG